MLDRALKSWMNGVVLATAAAMVVTPRTSAQAHRKIEIAPALGAYAPGGSLADPLACGYLKSIPSTWICEVPHLKQDRAVAFGGRVTAWLGKRGAIEGSFWYAPSGVTDTTRYTTARQIGRGDGKVFLTSLRAVVNVVAPVPAMSVFLMAGPVVIQRAYDPGPYGEHWADVSQVTAIGGVLGVGLDIHPGHGLGVRAAIEGYPYRFDAQRHEVSESAFPHNLVFSLSMGRSIFGQDGNHGR